jgi:hypothetical protein
MTKDQGELVTSILESRSGLLTEVLLVSGQTFVVHNVAAGRDMGVDFDHFTTNISPTPVGSHTIDFFHADQVASITAMESGNVLFAA